MWAKTLIWPDVRRAGHVGIDRYTDSRARGYTHRTGGGAYQRQAGDFRLEDDVIGACGELVASYALGVPWPATVGHGHRDPDLPPDWQVKTRRRTGAPMRVRRDDIPTQKFVLVWGTPPTFTVVGWITAAEAQRIPPTDPYRDGNPCHWIGPELLYPIGASHD